jgi:hypothetical protein
MAGRVLMLGVELKGLDLSKEVKAELTGLLVPRGSPLNHPMRGRKRLIII